MTKTFTDPAQAPRGADGEMPTIWTDGANGCWIELADALAEDPDGDVLPMYRLGNSPADRELSVLMGRLAEVISADSLASTPTRRLSQLLRQEGLE